MPIEAPSHERCPFCSNIAGLNQCAVVEDLPDTFAFVNPRMFDLGHVLVVPKRHAPTMLDLHNDEAAAIMRTVHRIAHAIHTAFDPSGLNVFQNNGHTAGQTVGHYHVHLVPSYPGDPPGSRIFRSDDFERTPYEERLVVAERIIRHLEPPAR